MSKDIHGESISAKLEVKDSLVFVISVVYMFI